LLPLCLLLSAFMTSSWHRSWNNQAGSTTLNLYQSGIGWNGPVWKPPNKKKLRSVPSAGKIMATEMWNEEGITLVNCWWGGTAVISDYYSQTPRKMSECSTVLSVS
jgi:hypothetical protein